jgi:hypothetical protein
MDYSRLLVVTTAAVSAIVGIGAASAADLPVRTYTKAPPAVLDVYNWTGFYIGGNLGAGFSNISLTDTNNNTFSSSLSGAFLGGGQAGVNYEFGGGVVIGAEAMFDWIPVTKNTITALNGASTASVTINNRWLMLATGRLGYAWDPCSSMTRVAAPLLAQILLRLRSPAQALPQPCPFQARQALGVGRRAPGSNGRFMETGQHERSWITFGWSARHLPRRQQRRFLSPATRSRSTVTTPSMFCSRPG